MQPLPTPNPAHPENPADTAVAMFNQGFNCSQAVFVAFAPQFGLDQPTALRLAGAFGGGIARLGETCGAVSGALLVIGLKYGQTIPGDSQTKEHTYTVARRFIERFTARCGSSKCRDLLGTAIDDPAGRQQAHAQNLFETVCPRLVAESSLILEALLGDES